LCRVCRQATRRYPPQRRARKRNNTCWLTRPNYTDKYAYGGLDSWGKRGRCLRPAGRRARPNLGSCVHSARVYASAELSDRFWAPNLGRNVHWSGMYANADVTARFRTANIGRSVHVRLLYAGADVSEWIRWLGVVWAVTDGYGRAQAAKFFKIPPCNWGRPCV